MRSAYRFNKKANLMIFHIMFKSRPKLCIVVLEDHGNNIVQEKDNNANKVDEMASMLRNVAEPPKIARLRRHSSSTRH